MVKLSGDNVIQNFEEQFKELRSKGHRKENGLSPLVMYTEDDEEMEEDFHDDSEDSHIETEERETLFMGTESEARRRFHRNGPYCSRTFLKTPDMVDPAEDTSSMLDQG